MERRLVSSAQLSLVAASALVLVTAGCGGSDSESSGGRGGLPGCKDVWKVGSTLPSDYDGCMSDPDTTELAVSVTCDDGSKFTTSGDRFFAKYGGKIAAGPNGADGSDDQALDEAYSKFYSACKG